MIEQKQLPTAEPQLDLETIRKRYYEAQTEIAALTALLATYDEEVAKLTRQRDLAEAREDNARTVRQAGLMLLSAIYTAAGDPERKLTAAELVDRIRRQRQAQPTLSPEVLAAPAVQGKPMGRVKTVGGYPDESEHTVEWLCKYKDLKDGDLLYTAPQPAEQQPAPQPQPQGGDVFDDDIPFSQFERNTVA